MAKSTVYFYQNDNTRKALAKIFSSIQELDQNHKAQVEYLFEQTAFRKDKKLRLKQLLNLLKTYSVNKTKEYLGVCFLSVKNMIKAFEEAYQKKISERAIQYLLADLEELGFIQRIPTLRESDNRQSTNIYRTLKMESSEEEVASSQEEAGQNTYIEQNTKDVREAEHEPAEASNHAEEFAHKDADNLRPKKAHSSFKALSKSLKAIKERKANVLQSLKQKLFDKQKSKKKNLLNFVPKTFKELFAPISSDPEEVYEFWKISKHICMHERKLDKSTTLEICQSVFMEFYQSCKAAARGKFKMHNPYGFYYSVMVSHSFAMVAKLNKVTLGAWIQN